MNGIVDHFQLDQQVVTAGRILTPRAVGGVGQQPVVTRIAVVLENDVPIKLLDGHAPRVYQRYRSRSQPGAYALLLLSVLLLSGCAGVVTRPAPEAVADTRPVFLLDHGRHASLVLTRADHSLVRYAHGDWTWYAEDRTGPLRAFSALMVRSRSAIGRRELSPILDEEGLRRQIRVEIRTLHQLAAAAEKIDALDTDLTQWFEDQAEMSLFNARFDLEFVPGPRPYTLFDNSNHVVAEWLEALGIKVRGNPVFGQWRLEDP